MNKVFIKKNRIDLDELYFIELDGVNGVVLVF